MELQCMTNEQEGLYWMRESPATQWKEEPIAIVKDSGWEERYLTVRPKGYVESILVRRHLQSEDRGNYFCYDQTKEHGFSTYIHVLKVSYQNVTAQNSTVVRLTCLISGFTNNPPRIDHTWVRNDVEFVPGVRPEKYKISTSFMDTTLSLDILNPNQADSGPYVCNFILYQKNNQYVIFSEQVHLNADHNPSSGSRVHPSIQHTPFSLVTLLSLAVYFYEY